MDERFSDQSGNLQDGVRLSTADALRQEQQAAKRATYLLQTVDDAFITLDQNFRIVYANPAAARMNGKKLSEFVGKSHWEEWPGTVGSLLELRYRRVMHTREPERFEFEYEFGDDPGVWLALSVYPAAEEDGGGIYVVANDITERKQHEQRQQFLIDLGRRLSRLKDPDEVIATVCNSIGVFLKVNRCLYADVDIEKNTSTIHPGFESADTTSVAGTWALSDYGPFLAERFLAGLPTIVNDIRDPQQVPSEYLRAYQAMGAHSFIAIPVVHSSRLVSVIAVHNCTPRIWTEAEVRLLQSAVDRAWLTVEVTRQSRALALSEQHLRLATEGANIGTWRWDFPTRALISSDKTKELFGGPSRSPTSTEAFIESVHAEDRDFLRSSIRSAIEAKVDFDIELRVIWADGSLHWLVVRGHCNWDSLNVPVSLEGIAIDITSRKLIEEEAHLRAKRASSLNTISKAILEMRESKAIQEIAMIELAKTLKVDRCLVILLDKHRDWVSFVSEWRRDDLPDLCGDYSLADFDVDINEIFAQSQPLVIPDLDVEQHLSTKSIDMLKSLQIRSFVDVPLSRDQEIVSVLGVYMADTAREWAADDISYIQSVASQLSAAIESQRTLSEAIDRAEREELVNKIGSVMRTAVNPEEIQIKAVNELGQALKADRCYFAIYDLTKGLISVAPDWHRSDLMSIAGVHDLPDTEGMFQELYPNTETSIIVDRDNAGLSSQTIENMKTVQIRSRLSVAIADSINTATLTAAMSDRARDWDCHDIELIERVASQLRPLLDMARARQREHKIANDLQAALLPKLPQQIPGLELAACMQPALDEAEIGGDFFDVFPLDNIRYAIVVGDVSGKGLAAAGQLATVRNSLRMALYQARGAAAAVASLNSILVSYRLITGFVTAFVGIYDTVTRLFTYTSCGHEPPLLLRPSFGSIDILETHSLPLGVDENAAYTDLTVQLDDGDTLLLYTDGLSESGPTRNELLGTQGLVEVLSQSSIHESINSTASTIIAKAKARAGVNFRDDVCVLMARVST